MICFILEPEMYACTSISPSHGVKRNNNLHGTLTF